MDCKLCDPDDFGDLLWGATAGHRARRKAYKDRMDADKHKVHILAVDEDTGVCRNLLPSSTEPGTTQPSTQPSIASQDQQVKQFVKLIEPYWRESGINLREVLARLLVSGETTSCACAPGEFPAGF